MDDSKDTMRDNATGSIDIFLFPTRYSDVVFCLPPEKA
jgi:hypothetical protein